jgi:3-hydroxyisobutyrate dehydrogenase-like beta-hydroxyacid dehydrogenase
VKRLGFICLGAMGAPMAGNLAASGFELAVFDVDQRRTARPRKASARTAGSASYAACATNATGILAAGGVMALLPAILVFLLLTGSSAARLLRGR